ncbi:MAG TPA: enoyl-CoA hydratase-related protein [Candidatus Krumholzibacteria bacterium]|nr:enoyl-CoA hydratase-related protein [Candidatus Krumholzibacteria bacterium]HPD71153.1 enoyl-CoA hydratase-related protein [Candidatus Krumholzibacteria bacterium]HRY39147.1 enoyl-CoA hydratase-related protein [Candidatus Krumholzibacteria bacterium]
MSSPSLQCRREGAVATVVVDRPQRLNALDIATISDLGRVFAELGQDDGIRAVVLTGAGDRAFVAGADIAELAALDPPGAERYAATGQSLMWRIENLGKPVVAAIGGFALGGGLELALACTIRWAADSARLGLPETGLGLIPGFGGTQRLPRLVGRGRALEMILGGEPITADQALAWGLVTRVLPRAEVLPQALDLAARLACRPAVALRAALKAVNEGAGMSADAAVRLEAALFGVTCASADAAEGCQAFLAKRPPEFRHR